MTTLDDLYLEKFIEELKILISVIKAIVITEEGENVDLFTLFIIHICA